MDTYLVGGAVRDALLGLPVTDRDHVVVGATPDEMGALGYAAVGRDFPVFLHPETHEEYALARTERKSGPGYRGFTVDSDPSVTLEQDLERRDLTINAMARRESGEIVDPRGGRSDLDARLLRHVSRAFVEDPVRVLRVARFMARFEPLGFTVAGDTLELMRSMVDAGEVGALVPERVWQETEKALGAERPRAFVETLQACGALRVVLPGLGALFDGDAARGETALRTLDAACERGDGIDVRFAALCHDVGERPEVTGSDGRNVRGVDTSALERLCDSLRVPKTPRELAIMVRRWQADCHRAHELAPDALGALLQALDVIRRPERFERFLLVCDTIREAPGVTRLRAAAGAWTSVDPGAIAGTTEPKSAIPETILAARIAALAGV